MGQELQVTSGADAQAGIINAGIAKCTKIMKKRARGDTAHSKRPQQKSLGGRRLKRFSCFNRQDQKAMALLVMEAWRKAPEASKAIGDYRRQRTSR